MEDNDGITSYVNMADPSGKIPADPAKFGPYEYSVYSLEKSFVETNDAVMGISIALESNGAFVRFPSEPRSNNYDSRDRSWYKNAKNKNGGVNFPNAYKASAGYKTIAVSKFFNAENGKPRGVISIDANVDYINQLLTVCHHSDEDELFILADNAGNIIVDQLDKTKEFT